MMKPLVAMVNLQFLINLNLIKMRDSLLMLTILVENQLVDSKILGRIATLASNKNKERVVLVDVICLIINLRDLL